MASARLKMEWVLRLADVLVLRESLQVFRCLIVAVLLVARVVKAEEVSFATMNCYWFLGQEETTQGKPRTTEDYSLKAGHLVGLLPAEAPLLVGLQEIGNDQD